MNTEFNTIETISNDTTVSNKAQAYLDACDSFEQEALKHVHNENYAVSKNSKIVIMKCEQAMLSERDSEILELSRAAEGFLSTVWFYLK